MDKLDAELRRLHLSPAEPPASGGQALCLGFRRAADWESVAALWHAAQAELDLPAPAMSIDGEGYRLWFSLAERVADETARRFIDGLIRRYLAELPDARLHINFAASPPPAELIPDERWAAFIDPGLGSMFAAEPWLDMAPNRNQQADLLAALRSIRPAELSYALDRMLAQTSPAVAPVALETLSLSGPFTHPRDFLLAVMNDPQAGSLARIEAAKALLPYFEKAR